MSLLFDSFWRAVIDGLHPRVWLLSLVPLLAVLLLGSVASHFWWGAALAWTRQVLDAWPAVAAFGGRFGGEVRTLLASLALALTGASVLVVLALLSVSALLTPALTRRVAARRFPALERRHGGTALGSIARSLGLTLMALGALVLTMPLWLVPPLVLVLPPLIWGWLTCRVMSFDALAEHASAEERATLMRTHRLPLLGIGVVCGLLGTAPSIVWASGLLFAAAFVVLVPLAIWIYTLVFAFSALWFAHYCLDALSQLRLQRAAASAAAMVPVPDTPGAAGVAPPRIVDSSAS